MATLVAEGLCLPGGRPPGAPTALVAVGGSLWCGRGAEHDVHGWGAAVTLVSEAGWLPSWPSGCGCPGGVPPGGPTALVAVGGSLWCGRGAEHDVHGWGAAVTLVTEAGWPPSWPKGCACPGGDTPEPPRRWLLWGVRCVVAGGQSMMFMAGVRRLLS